MCIEKLYSLGDGILLIQPIVHGGISFLELSIYCIIKWFCVAQIMELNCYNVGIRYIIFIALLYPDSELSMTLLPIVVLNK